MKKLSLSMIVFVITIYVLSGALYRKDEDSQDRIWNPILSKEESPPSAYANTYIEREFI